jgi:glutamate-1-semialdehyde 2,1-aminomutase
LGPVTLGYSIPEINSAMARRIEEGVVFGHPHPLEGDAAKMLAERIPCAEKVRFLKTGGEAVAACIKLARLSTGRDEVLHCGYNGWLNNFGVYGRGPAGITLSRPLGGIPSQVSSLHTAMPWADKKAWDDVFREKGSKAAAVVIACDYERMEKGAEFLPFIRELTEKMGIVMIMDEIVTGFRIAVGGAHEYFSFKPDMAVFSKGIANGMPLSAYMGRNDLMDKVREAGISSTFGGETVSLAAAKAVMEFYQKNNVIKKLWDTGKLFQDRVNYLFGESRLHAKLSGFPVCPVFKFESVETRNAFFKACWRRGVSLYDVSYVNYSHEAGDIEEAVSKIREALSEII